jgi:hypothetical protein
VNYKITDFRYTELPPAQDLKSTLQRVEINPTELCNRSCGFCPRSDPTLYKNRKLHISTKTSKLIGQQLEDMNFTGTIGFVGFGEPMLHPTLAESIRTLRLYAKSATMIEVNTNGDFLTKESATRLVDAGCTNITVSMYDANETEKFQEMCCNLDVTLNFRHHYDASVNYNLQIVNRIEILDKNADILSIAQPCYIPFYRLFIDWNGDYLLCNQDWGRSSGNEFNIYSTTIEEYWLKQINKYRIPLINSDRSVYKPCTKCNINGTLRGQENFNLIANYLTHSA